MSPTTFTAVIPAKAGIQYAARFVKSLARAFTGSSAFADDDDSTYFTTAAVCPNSSLRSSSVRIAGWPKFGLISLALA